jgi:nucleoside-diphosphate-sugar epimerase
MTTVFHLAANADVRFGLEHPDKDFQQNTIGTFNVLEAMRAGGDARTIAFSSTGSVYGEPTKTFRPPRITARFRCRPRSTRPANSPARV